MSAVDALTNLARDAGRFTNEWPRRAARLIEDEARQQLLRDTGDGRFSRSTMAAGQVVTRSGSGQADVMARGGVWTWLEEGTRPHTTRAGAGKVVRTPFGPRPEVRVRGVRPRRTWTRATATAMPAVERDADQALTRLVR